MTRITSAETKRGLRSVRGVGVAVLLTGALCVATALLQHRPLEVSAAELPAAGAPRVAGDGGQADIAAPSDAALRFPSLLPAAMQISLSADPPLPVLDFDAAAADAAKGAALYAARCSGCHGGDGAGKAIGDVAAGGGIVFPRLAGQPGAYLYRQLVSYERGLRASPQMAAMAKIATDEEKRDLAAYLAGLSAPYAPAPSASDAELSVGRALATDGRPDLGVSPCGACHGSDGRGVPPHFPALYGQDAEYLAAQLGAFATGTRTNGLLHLMRPVATGLSEAERMAVARYFAQLPHPTGGGAGQ